MAIPYFLDPNSRPGNRLLNAATHGAYIGGIMDSIAPPPQMPQANAGVRPPMAPAGLVQVPEEKPGILGRIGSALANPAVNQRLMALGSELLANSGYQTTPVTTGAGLGRGLQAMNQAGLAYDQMIAKQAADRLNTRLTEAQIAKAEREAKGEPGAWDTDLGRQVAIVEGQLVADGMPAKEARFKALDMVSKQRQMELIDARANAQKDVLSYADQIAQAKEGRAPTVAAQTKSAEEQAIIDLAQKKADAEAAIAGAKEGATVAAREGATAAAAGTGIEQTRNIIAEMKQLIPNAYVGASLTARGARGASETLGVDLDPQKAANTEKLKNFGTQLKFAAKPPGMGAMSDSEWAIITGAVGDPTKGSPQTYQAALEALDFVLAGRMPPDDLRARYGYKPKQAGGNKPQGAPASGGKLLRWNPETGRVE